MKLLTCACLLASAGVASAQGLTLFGEARLGLGYNIDNDGGATGEDDLRAVSRVRFGALMVGESASGINFGAEIRGDNAIGGDGDPDGQTEGNVFVTGAWGSLTFGDTNGADEQNVGDLNEVGLTCLGCENETPFISNGGGYGSDQLNFADNPSARPTIRYDYAFDALELSVSSNRDLTDVGVGARWTAELAGSVITVGGGYYDYAAFTDVLDPDEDPLTPDTAEVAAGTQWSAALSGEYGGYNAKLIYTTADSVGDASFATLGGGFGAEIGLWAVNAYYMNVIDASGALADDDGDNSLGFGVNYDLGGGALVQFGIANTYAGDTVSDFGIFMAF